MSKRTHTTLLSFILLVTMLSCNLLSTLRATEIPTEPIGEVPSEEVPPVDTEEVSTLPSPTPPAGARPPAFASYKKVTVSLPDTFTGYDLPLDLAAVENLDFFELSMEQKALLTANGFVVESPVPGDFREFYQVYESWRYSEQPVFITTDSMLHVYHLLFDKLLRDLETRRFIPILEVLTETMIETSQAQLEDLRGTALEEPARRNLAFFAVAARLLEMDLETPPEVADLVQTEVALIEAHSQPSVSPIWDREDLEPDKKLIEDYSQYIPRGHYTRSDDLKRYFKTMMWYGRLTFRLRDPFETQRALLITHALRTSSAADGNPASTLWSWIYEPTVFLVGKADDLSYFEYGALSDSIFGPNPGLDAFGDPALLEAYLEAAEQLPPPQVNSMWVWIWEDTEEATKGYRFMGQRFTIDAYVFGQMIWRKVGTMSNPRGLPKALDFFAALGSEEALGLLDEMGETEYENFDTQMEKVRGELQALQEDTWTENVYWSWLYALQPIIEVKDESYPEFMRTQAWTRKDLNTALGSYTELKHDTILYAKQVMAELGGGPMEIPKGYIEPNPEAFARLKALAEMTRDGLSERNLLDDAMLANLDNLIDLLGFLKDTSEKLLWGEVLTEDDYLRINFFGGELEALTIAAADCEGEAWECRDLQDQQAALVADIATGISPDSPGLVVLEEAIGQPTPIYVILPDSPYRIGVGAVFTYYEFEVPAESRMTDEEWQAQVAAGTNPAPPYWTESFMAQ
ncbi:MAG: hypothetical protein A2Z14_13265 [Chloroflexi bacterium RBG_16_48_8]|nr:MAG: hypothetical protein A2Z14_13265 [Chloroflexi bacterium RBG_16_48_8]